MHNKQNFIDNIDGNTLKRCLEELLLKTNENHNEIKEIEARISTAYFSPAGFSNIAKSLSNLSSIKILLGTDPISDAEKWQRKLGESDERFKLRKLREKEIEQINSMRLERDNLPFNHTTKQALRQLVKSLRTGDAEVRRYEKNFLHAKAYIFSSEKKSNFDSIIAGSSNLTAGGLVSNLELNLGNYEKETITKAIKWFNKLWNDSSPFDLASFFEEIFEAKNPFDIFLRVLWELYGNEIDEEADDDEGLPLTSFQKHGVYRALRLIKENGGVIVADEVGLGKTFIAAEILSRYQEKRQRALLICPAFLRDTAWKTFLTEHQRYLESLSFEQFGLDNQLKDEIKRPLADKHHIERKIEEYQLVIVDEAHNYRNPSSNYRYDALRSFLYGKKKDVLFLTATPVNNTLWDLYNLTRFFLKQDTFFANKGIISIKGKFDEAMKTNPHNLSPDVLYPIIDSTTVKRTRKFIKKHYSGDQIVINGQKQTIVFPDPKAISIRYDLEELFPGLFELIEGYLDPESPLCIKFARYKTYSYLKKKDLDEEKQSNAVTGLLLSGLLKRFESSTGAFISTIKRLIDQHEIFIQALESEQVLTGDFYKEITDLDDDNLEELLKSSPNTNPTHLFDIKELTKDVEEDLIKLQTILKELHKIKPGNDPKLIALEHELEKIVAEAEEGINREEKINKRKVIIFTFFTDTVSWINSFLRDKIATNPKLKEYQNRIATVSGSALEGAENKAAAAARFAPDTAGRTGGENATDILISTDVLAEGVNLQQARHIINYDLPWNPMKLVQRHGRIDRIGSKHLRVFMRTIFPASQLDKLLNLEEKIGKKIAMAAVSIGVVSPIAEVEGASRDFTETRDEINKLLNEDASLYEEGTNSSSQTGEEYRQTLRKVLENQERKEEIINIPWKAGSGMRKGKYQGIFFLAKVGERSYLRFVHADKEWKLKYFIPSEYKKKINEQLDLGDKKLVEGELELHKQPMINEELGFCLRIIECDEKEKKIMNNKIEEAAYNLWLETRKNILGFFFSLFIRIVQSKFIFF